MAWGAAAAHRGPFHFTPSIHYQGGAVGAASPLIFCGISEPRLRKTFGVQIFERCVKKGEKFYSELTDSRIGSAAAVTAPWNTSVTSA
jgi:hypothetical protein